MSKPRFDKPLSVAAAESLRYAAKAARAKAAETGGGLVVWKGGRVVTERVRLNKTSPKRGLVVSRKKVKGKA